MELIMEHQAIKTKYIYQSREIQMRDEIKDKANKKQKKSRRNKENFKSR